MIHVRLFAAYRAAVGAAQVELDPEDAATVEGAWAALVRRHPDLGRLTPSAAVNARFVPGDTALSDGDEIAFLPPVSGG